MSLFKKSSPKSRSRSKSGKKTRGKTKRRTGPFGDARPWLVGFALVVIVGGVGFVKWSRTGSGQATLLTLGSDKMYGEVQLKVEEALLASLSGFNPGPADATGSQAGTSGGGHDWPAEQLGPGAAVRCRIVPVSGDISWWDLQARVADAVQARGGRVLWAERLYPGPRLPKDQIRPNEEKDFLRLDVGVPGRPTHTLVLHRAGRKADIKWGGGPGSTAWSRFMAAEGPVVALLIDDWGYSKSEAARSLLSLPAPITLAILPGLPYSRYFAIKRTDLVLPPDWAQETGPSADTTALARRQRMAAGCFVEVVTAASDSAIPSRRREIMLHLPMEPQGYPDPDPGPRAVMVGMDEAAIGARIDEARQALPGITGVNNHMGSAATSDPATMESLMRALAERDLMFIDSLTSSTSVAYSEAGKAGLSTAKNRIFLDDDNQTKATIKANLEVLVRSARSSGFALGIGHPHRTTAEVLAREVPRLMAEGVRFVTVSEMLALRDRTTGSAKGE